MRISEIIELRDDRLADFPDPLMQRISNSFTRRGMVKGLDLGRSGQETFFGDPPALSGPRVGSAIYTPADSLHDQLPAFTAPEQDYAVGAVQVPPDEALSAIRPTGRQHRTTAG
jgi:hypothetical protein